MKKRILPLLLSLALCATLVTPAFAASDVTIATNNDGTPATGNGYVIPGVISTETYEANPKEGLGEDWRYGLDISNITAYVIPVGTKIDTSGMSTMWMGLELNEGKLDDFGWPDNAVKEDGDFDDNGMWTDGSYIQFDAEGFYALVFAYGDWIYYQNSVVHVVADGNATPVTPTATSPAVDPTVAPVANPATLDGKAVTLNAYLFTEGNGGTNYVMLRDVASLLNGTKAQFEVSWNAADGITLTTDQPYTAVGGELQSKGTDSKPYTANTSTITIDGEAVELTAYTIEGNNYFKLRDLGAALGFNVSWDKDKGVTIDSNAPYSAGT